MKWPFWPVERVQMGFPLQVRIIRYQHGWAKKLTSPIWGCCCIALLWIGSLLGGAQGHWKAMQIILGPWQIHVVQACCEDKGFAYSFDWWDLEDAGLCFKQILLFLEVETWITLQQNFVNKISTGWGPMPFVQHSKYVRKPKAHVGLWQSPMELLRRLLGWRRLHWKQWGLSMSFVAS